MAYNPNAFVDGVMNGFSLHIEPPRTIRTWVRNYFSIRLTLYLMCNFACLFVVCWLFFQNQPFKKIFQDNCLSVKCSDPEFQTLGMTWVPTVCKGYKQTTLGVKRN